jgi:pyridoxal phosphate enzyme (YggS family)
VIDSQATLQDRLEEVRSRIHSASERAGRDPGGVLVVAVTKEVPVDVAGWALEAGLTDLGENYVKEMATKVEVLPRATWHYVGALQGSTAHRVADLADVVHSLVPGRAASRLAGRAERSGKVLPAMIQVDLAGRGTGVRPEEVPAFARRAASMPEIELRGLMTLPPEPELPEDSRPFFRRLRELRNRVREDVDGFDDLSMGMSADFEVAVEEGATMVRIGTALFGERPSHRSA